MNLPEFYQLYMALCCGGRCLHCTVREDIHDRYVTGVYADKAATLKIIEEIACLGGKSTGFEGGDALLVDWLPEALALCKRLDIKSSITLCGPSITSRLASWGEDWLALPELVSFSIDGNEQFHNSIRAGRDWQSRTNANWYTATVAGLEVASRIRKPLSTLISCVLMPGKYGNINKQQLESVLALAIKYDTVIDASPLFGTDFAGNKESCLKSWHKLDDDSQSLLDWFCDQDEVHSSLISKLHLIDLGGNDIDNPICDAFRKIAVISPQGKLIGPCIHNPRVSIPIIPATGLYAALRSPERLENLNMAGRMPELCDGCEVWCNLKLPCEFTPIPSLWNSDTSGIPQECLPTTGHRASAL